MVKCLLRYPRPDPIQATKRLRGLRETNHKRTLSFIFYKLHNSRRRPLLLIMAPKRNPRDTTPSSTTVTAQSSGTSTPIPPPIKPKQSSNLAPHDIALGVWKHYLDNTPQRTKLIDVFMVFLVVVGCLQFVYCVISGNYVRIARYAHRYTGH